LTERVGVETEKSLIRDESSLSLSPKFISEKERPDKDNMAHEYSMLNKEL
jgi:hypothetical protein